MNFFGISLANPTVQNAPLTPQDAPLRPGLLGLIAACCGLLVPASLFAFVINVNPVIGSIGWIGIAVGLVVPLLYRRRYDRIGWYERRVVVLPELPFEMRGTLHRILFGTEGITFSTFLTHDQNIAYSEIVSVSLHCEGHCLSGVTIRRSVKPYHSATEPKPPQSSFIISDGGDGERTRIALAILRAKTPQAKFSGPQWIEEGWVPRLGFTHPSANGSGGAGF